MKTRPLWISSIGLVLVQLAVVIFAPFKLETEIPSHLGLWGIDIYVHSSQRLPIYLVLAIVSPQIFAFLLSVLKSYLQMLPHIQFIWWGLLIISLVADIFFFSQFYLRATWLLWLYRSTNVLGLSWSLFWLIIDSRYLFQITRK